MQRSADRFVFRGGGLAGEVTHGYDWMASTAPPVAADAPKAQRQFTKARTKATKALHGIVTASRRAARHATALQVFQEKLHVAPALDTHSRIFADAGLVRRECPRTVPGRLLGRVLPVCYSVIVATRLPHDRGRSAHRTPPAL